MKSTERRTLIKEQTLEEVNNAAQPNINDTPQDQTNPAQVLVKPKIDNPNDNVTLDQDQTQKKELPSTASDIKQELNNVNYRLAVNAAPTIESIAATPYVRPTAVQIYSDYNTLLNLNTDNYTPSNSYQIALVSKVQHFLRLFISNTSGQPTHSVYTTYDNLPNFNLFTDSKEVFGDGIKLCLMGIDCNRTNAKIILDPFSPILIDTDSLSAELEVLSLSIGRGISPIVQADKTIISYLAIAVYINRVSSFIGNYIYCANNDVPSVIANMTSRNDYDPANYISFDPITDETGGESIYIGRISQIASPLLEDLSGTLPRDDYKRYPRLEMMRQYLPSDWMKNYAANHFPLPKLGSISEEMLSIQGHKVSELCYMGSDPVMYQLQQSSLKYLKSLAINYNQIKTLIDAMLLKRTDLREDQLRNVRIFSTQVGHINLPNEYVNFCSFPHTRLHEHAFRIIEIHSTLCRTRVFQHLNKHATRIFSNFPFDSVSNFREALQDNNTLLVNSAITTQLTPLLIPLSETRVDANVLGVKLSLELYAPFNYFNIMPNFNNNLDKNPIAFVVDLMSLVVTKYLYYQTWCYNQAAWYTHVQNFFRIYFTTDAMEHEGIYKFGSDALGNTYFNEPNLNRMTDPLSIYSYSSKQPFIKTNNTLQFRKDLIDMLCLFKNDIGYFEDVDFGDYGIGSNTGKKGRRIYVPGTCHAPYAAINQSPKPLTKLLMTVTDRISQGYRFIATGSNSPKTYIGAVTHVLNRFQRYSFRFGEWFHCVYAPTYLSLSRAPFLIHDCVKPDDPHCQTSFAIFDSARDSKLKIPTPVSLPFINSSTTMYGRNQLTESWNMIATCYAPGATHSPEAPNLNYLDSAQYGTLYTPIYANDSFKFYKDELIRRHALLESIYMTNDIINGNMFDSIPSIRRAITSTYPITSLPMISYIYLGKAVGNVLAQEDSNLNAYQRDYYELVPRELRIMSPAICRINTDSPMTPSPGSELRGMNVTRPYIINNRDLLFSYLFGDNALRPLTRGLTISREHLSFPIEFHTTHHLPHDPIDIYVSAPPHEELTTNKNYTYSMSITASTPTQQPGVTVKIDPSRIDLLHTVLVEHGIIFPVLKPYFRVVLADRPLYLIDPVIDFYYELYKSGDLIVVNNYIYTYSYYSLTTPQTTHEVTPISRAEFVDLFNANHGTLAPIRCCDTTTTTNSQLLRHCNINLLMTNPEPPVLVLKDLSGGTQFGTIQPYHNPNIIVEPGIPTNNGQVVDGTTVPMLNSNPYSLNTLERVSMMPPISIFPVLVTDASFLSLS